MARTSRSAASQAHAVHRQRQRLFTGRRELARHHASNPNRFFVRVDVDPPGFIPQQFKDDDDQIGTDDTLGPASLCPSPPHEVAQPVERVLGRRAGGRRPRER